jgi:hypothetical protein
MQGDITRLASRNHKVSTQIEESNGKVRYAGKTPPSQDFVLLIRDSLVNIPVGFEAVNELNEQAFMVNILTDITAKTPPEQLDFDPNAVYEEEESKVSQLLNEYIFLIDRSGSMEG